MSRFAAFQHRTFRRYFAGQVISSVGSWLQTLAVTWLVLDLTGRSDRLGIAVALQFLPLLVLGVPAGVLADRVDNRRLLLRLAVSAVVMFGFGFLLVPFYEQICEATGINNYLRPEAEQGARAVGNTQVDSSRSVLVTSPPPTRSVRPAGRVWPH